jgi:dihydrofolate reductase
MDTAYEIILIVAMAANRVIGRDNDIPWHIPGEQTRFKQITMGHPMIMGRLTWDSIGRPLPGRRNIVVTRDLSFRASGVEVVHSLEQGLESCRSEKKIFIIGGAQIFKLALPLADTLILTVLPEPVSGNVYFPDFSPGDFIKISSEEVPGPVPYLIDTFKRKK